jgi:hypothetical protein
MYKDCITKHPAPKPPARKPKGGGGNGGTGQSSTNGGVTCHPFIWDVFSGTICTDGSGCFEQTCGCYPEFARPGVAPCRIAGLDLDEIISRPVASLQDLRSLDNESIHALGGSRDFKFDRTRSTLRTGKLPRHANSSEGVYYI